MSMRKITSNRRTLIRSCFICGKTFITTASTPFMRQMKNVNGKKQATVYFCSEGCKKSSYKHIGWFDGKADIRREEREAKRDIKEKNRRYYLALDFISSQSTMHRIADFWLDDQYDKYTDPRCIDIVKGLICKYKETKDPEDYLRVLMSNPCGFKLTAGMTTNYRQLKTIYAQRKNHRLPEWREFCQWIETLPMSELIVGGKKDD